jgi:hypothetical protein
VSLGTLFLACQLADLVWPNLVLLGVESFEIDPGNTVMTPLDFSWYPYSHSLLAMALWAAVFAIAYLLLTRASTKVAVVLALVVLSHWVLDVVTHRPDMPLTIGGSTLLGLGLWNLPVWAVSVELLLFAVGAGLYARCTRPKNRRGKIGFWVLIGFLLLVYVGNILGPSPPSVLAVAWSAQAMWLIVAWGYWIDRNREYLSA